MVFFIGTAGSGKSTLVSALYNWMDEQGYDVAVVNLDPAAEYLPYVPDVDIRDKINARKIMRQFKLGPNASIIASIDMAVAEGERIKEEINAVGAPVVLVDTPGQMELFAFRESGPYLVRRLSDTHNVVVYVGDGTYMQTPEGFASTALLAISARIRFKLPQIFAVNKMDLLGEEQIERINDWISDAEMLADSLQLGSLERDIIKAVSAAGGLGDAVFVSALSGTGIDRLYYAIQLHYTGGEDQQLPP
ncbi:GTPase SAR1 related protein [Thermoproteus tenax Kra 1]|uniref:GTPase SAR1 related protein n=2 Tax=Thermoproteus tenax TaxID=2271 RepID=G4RML8_THETK|nr:ATP/GTP-binding protein [Thermoproteus tenax]CCC82694.1 GTPase SAR1 related protein [Thermoproteus tenax Kra 1]